ncbi:MAG: cytochrome c [Thermoleophilia bacterium]|nr:cytochrome c [Thermoleophilia bacterium]
MARVDERRQAYASYKEDVQRRGKPFYPYAMFHDTVMSVVVVAVIVALACIWYFDSNEEPGEEGAGILGPRYTEKADPGTISFIPRPDWYFFFLFYLLRIFKWPESVILATIGVPTILLILLISLPFLDRRRERRPLRRPVAVVAGVLVMISMGVLTYKGGTVREALGATAAEIDTWFQRNNLPEEARPGAEFFAETCTQCHTYLGSGSANLGAPDLSAVGATGRNVEAFIQIMREGPGAMPSFATQPEENLRAIAVFLEASKGPGGG